MLDRFPAPRFALPFLMGALAGPGCFQRIDADESYVAPECENSGVNPDVGASLDAGKSNTELLAEYGVSSAVRLVITLDGAGHYVGGDHCRCRWG